MSPGVQDQLNLCKAIQGTKVADKTASNRRIEGWKLWADNSTDRKAYEFEKNDMPSIMNSFSYLLSSESAVLMRGTNTRRSQSAKNEIIQILIQSNLIEGTVDNDEETNLVESSSEPHQKRLKTTPQETHPVQQQYSWRMQYLKSLAEVDPNTFAIMELALFSNNGSTEFTKRGLEAPILVIEEVAAMTCSKKSGIERNFKKVRDCLFQDQLFKPQKEELLVDFYSHLERLNNGERLPTTDHRGVYSPYKRRENNQLFLKDSSVEVLRCTHYTHNIPLSRLPSLLCTVAPFFLGRALSQEEFPSETNLRSRFSRLYHIDRFFLQDDFLKYTAKFDNYGNRILFFSCDDDSKHLKQKRHALLFTMKNQDQQPTFRLGTTASAVTSDAEGNSNLNVSQLSEALGDNMSALAHYGGGTTDNANDAISTTRMTFSKIQEKLHDQDRLSNGVARMPLVFGDPFHIANLVCTWGSIAAFGQTERGNHNQVHHRQLMQSLHDAVSPNKDIAGEVELELLQKYNIEKKVHVKTVRERQQRWMVNQRQSQHFLDLHSVDCDGDSFFFHFCKELASRLRSISGYQADAAEHAGKLMAMPEIRTALHFESGLGKYFDPVMAWHSRKGLLSDRSGFRMMEVHDFFFNFELPFWKRAIASPEQVFSNTFKSLESIADTTRRTRKREQVLAGIQASYDELLKMSKFYFQPSHIFLVLLLSKEGGHFARSLLRFLKTSSDDDSFRNVNFDLILRQSQLEKDFDGLLHLDPPGVILWFKHHGLSKKDSLAEIVLLSKELEPTNRRDLLQFKVAYPAIFTTLYSAFGLMPSASRLAEQLHGMLRAHLTGTKESSSHQVTDQRQEYMLSQEYPKRVARRRQVEERMEKRPMEIKHEASKAEQQLVGEQVLVSMANYEESFLDKFLTAEQKNEVKVHVINNKGVKGKDKARAVAKNEKAKEKALRRSKADKTIQDFEREAQAETVDNDNDWVDYDDQVVIQRKKEISTVAFWKEQTLEVLLERYKYIFPGIEDASLGKKGVVTKTNILKLISAYIKADPSRIDLQHAVGLDSKSDTGASKRKKAMAAFFKNSGSTDVFQHYFEFSSV